MPTGAIHGLLRPATACESPREQLRLIRVQRWRWVLGLAVNYMDSSIRACQTNNCSCADVNSPIHCCGVRIRFGGDGAKWLGHTCVTRRKQHRLGIAPNTNTTHVPTAGSSAALTKPNQTPTRHPRAKGKIILQTVTTHAA